MNAVLFNTSLSEARPSMDGNGLQGFYERCSLSPLIVWDQCAGSGYDKSLAEFQNGFPKLPFPNFRADITMSSGGKKVKAKGWVVSYNYGDDPFYEVAIEMGGDRIAFAYISFVNGRPLGHDCYFCRVKKKFVLESLFEKKDWAYMFWQWVVQMSFDFQNPHFHCTKVSPPNPAKKSAEWVKAREHYVLLHKSHPANQKIEVNRRQAANTDTVDRAAHSRRAHYRMLRSPRFRNKIGQRVWVKSAWCGPKEWTDRSGQIYRIVDIDNSQP